MSKSAVMLTAALLCGQLAVASGHNSLREGAILDARSDFDLSSFPASSGSDLEERDFLESLARRQSNPKAPTVLKMVQNYAGKTFFNAWDFFTYPDPTHGQVTYVDQSTATKNGLISINAKGNAVMKVDNKTKLAKGANRQSVRITSKIPFVKGQMLVLTATHMPTGCTTWPAFWTCGPNWPNGGEIDIVEGVNNFSQNQYTLHTTQGCSSTSNQSPQRGSGILQHTDCNVYAYGGANYGCGIQDRSTQSFGPGFNRRGGGAFVTYWDDQGIRMWFFPMNKLPWDLRRARPIPESWGTPQAFFSVDNCNMDKYFGNQTVVINTTLNGDWAGAVYSQQGCPGSASDFVANPSNYGEAYWEIQSVRVYQ